MKDHELRELINDVTTVARIYAHTQQLREQIAQLIIPALTTHTEPEGYKLVPIEATDEMALAAMVGHSDPARWMPDRKRIYKVMVSAAPKL